MITKFKKRKKRGFLENTFFPICISVLILIGIIFLVFQTIKITQKKAKLTAQLITLQKEIQELEKKNEEFKNGIAQLQNTDYIEKIAREELNLQKEGEKVVGFVFSQEEQAKTEKKEFWNPKNWLNWIKEKFEWIKNKFLKNSLH